MNSSKINYVIEKHNILEKEIVRRGLQHNSPLVELKENHSIAEFFLEKYE